MTTRNPHLLLISGIGGHAPEDALDSLARISTAVSVVHLSAWGDPEPVRADWARRGLEGEFLTAADLDEAVTAGLALHERHALSGVVTYSELLLRPQAELAERLGLPGNTLAAVTVAQSKSLQRQVFADHGVPSPRFAVVREERDLAAAAREIGLPAVFKPSLGAGSQSVRLVTTQQELVEAYRAGRATASAFLQKEDVFLLEERLELEADGDTGWAAYCSVESLLAAGERHHLVVCDRLPLTHGYAEEGVSMPSRLDAAARAAAVDCADQAIAAIGLTTGAVHTEIALTPAGPRVIEVNARAGGPMPVMFEVSADYDYAGQIARSAAGLAPDTAPEFSRVALLRMLPIPAGEWRVTAQSPTEEVLAAFPELSYVAPRFKTGGQVSRNRTLHLATFLLGAPTPGEARALADRVERALGIELEEAGAPPAPARAA
ncbi:acetyl-CoA carboxylase biotin carboxylase subunit family protein [Streptomyces sp. NBC_01408]|uniref:ATP-grasp domain-containing protein n=1 Tax=Streptomyces sp. NBC_01408 TaxID=2903855 RepID=UPI002252C349|nr:ATP-grasp domain-containing protein [Streptomyces sp. NBC_01408]MCX4696579.1 ATP-grasp domain-containing protein [Streptomyces sp. NBC_01408]